MLSSLIFDFKPPVCWKIPLLYANIIFFNKIYFSSVLHCPLIKKDILFDGINRFRVSVLLCHYLYINTKIRTIFHYLIIHSYCCLSSIRATTPHLNINSRFTNHRTIRIQDYYKLLLYLNRVIYVQAFQSKSIGIVNSNLYIFCVDLRCLFQKNLTYQMNIH